MAARRVISFTGFVVILSLARLSASAAQTTGVPIRLEPDGLVSVEAAINGAGPFRLMLDTGANASVVSAGLARALRLAPVARTTVMTAAGTSARTVVRLDDVALGRVRKPNLLATVLDEDDLEILGAGISGILGQNFLLDQNYTLDYRARRLTWLGGGETATLKGTRLALRASEGRWLVELPQGEGSGQPMWFVPDSGASSLVIFERGGAPPIDLVPVTCCAGLETVAGAGRARLATLPRLRVGPLQFRDYQAVVVRRPESDAPGGDGLLPLSIFASVTFDAVGRGLWLRGR